MPHTGREACRDIMPTQITAPETESIGGPGPATDPEGRAARAFQLAAAVLADLQRHGIPPTPRAYELWSAYRRGVIPELTRRLSELLEQGAPVTPAALDALYSACVAGAEPDLDALGTGADAIQVEAQAVVEQVNSGWAAIRDYGEALTRGAAQLGQDQTQAGLVRHHDALGRDYPGGRAQPGAGVARNLSTTLRHVFGQFRLAGMAWVWGGLIQAAVGFWGGLGGCLTKRSGCSAKARSRVA